MNPFTFDGRLFVLMFSVVALFAIMLQKFLCRKQILDTSARIHYADPYLLAFLSRGPVHAINVATFSLIERKLLAVDGQNVTLARPDAKGFVRRSLEKAILDFFTIDTNKASMVTRNAELLNIANRYETKLIKLGLFPTGEYAKFRRTLTLSLQGVLLLIVGLKVCVTLVDEHLFLLVSFCIVLTIITYTIFPFKHKRRVETDVVPIPESAEVTHIPTPWETKLSKSGLFSTESDSSSLYLFLCAIFMGFFVVINIFCVDGSIFFLCILTVVACGMMGIQSQSRLTVAGEQIIKNQKELFKNLKNSELPGKAGEIPDMVFMFALFGLSVLPAEAYGWQAALKPEGAAHVPSGNGCSSCSSSSCSSGSDSGGSSCGSSCGGCGGGCG